MDRERVNLLTNPVRMRFSEGLWLWVFNCTAIISTGINNLTNVNDVVGIMSAPIYQLLFTIKIKYFFTFLSKTEASVGTEPETLGEYHL